MLLAAMAAGAGDVLISVGAAALCHELGHFSALWLTGTPVEEIHFTVLGVEIRADTQYLPYWSDILCTLAGPAVNLMLAVVCARWGKNYILAGANLLQGGFNLLPISGLDGARALHLFFSWVLDPPRADRILRWIELWVATAFFVAALALVVWRKAGLFLLLVTGGILRNTIRTWWGK